MGDETDKCLLMYDNVIDVVTGWTKNGLLYKTMYVDDLILICYVTEELNKVIFTWKMYLRVKVCRLI